MITKKSVFGFALSMAIGAGALAHAAGGVTAAADTATPTVTGVLFDAAHIKDLPVGTELVYELKRDVSEPKLAGPSFTDQVKVDVDDKAEDGTRTVTIQAFTGKRQRAAQKIAGMTGNPVLVFYLDRAVFGFNALAGGKRAYLKNRFRIALGETAEISPAKVRYDGATVDAHRVVLTPYAKDLNRDKMRGYEESRFELVVSPKVPGHFVFMKSGIESEEPSAPDIVETLALKGAEVVE
jgi:hypothetical protein